MLSKQLQRVTDFIFLKPQVVVRILKNNGIKVSSKPTLMEINKKTIKAFKDQNRAFTEELFMAIETNDESNFVITTMAVIGIVTSIGTAILGAHQAKKQREMQESVALMNLAHSEKMTLAQIQADRESERLSILANTIHSYSETLQLESTQRQKDTGLLIGIIGVSMAILYSSIQLLKK